MSDHGRILYAPGGLIYTFKGGELTVCGEDIVYKTLDGGIKACFEYLKTNIFPDDGEFPDEDLIIHPQYNTWIELTHCQCEEHGRRITAFGIFTPEDLKIQKV